MEDRSHYNNNDPYMRGHEAFVAEDYDKAIHFYSEALRRDSEQKENVYLSRSHAYLKKEDFNEAKKDAQTVIEMARRNKVLPDQKAFLRSGIASFHLGNYEEAKACFQEALHIYNDVGTRQWLTWCDEKRSKVESKKQETYLEDNVAALSLEPKINYDWYQTDSLVVVEIRIKGVKEENVDVSLTQKSLSLNAVLPNGHNYQLNLNLSYPVVDNYYSCKVLSTKIEIKLMKTDGVRWPSLERQESQTPIPTSYPSSSGKNWSQIEVDIKKQLEDDKDSEGDPLNNLFQKIYADGSDEVRKAMNKSFQESKGTVLSTNWANIKKETVEVKPPDGLEFKQWN